MLSLADFSLKQQILIHLNYRDIFNFPIRKNELVLWLNKEEDQELNQAIRELESESLITFDGDYLCIKGKEWMIEERIKKQKLMEVIIQNNSSSLKWMKKIPFLRYIGISGSLAAENPTIDKHGPNKGRVDFDLFMIVKNDTIWILFYFIRALKNLSHLFQIKTKNVLCMNFVMDESFMDIPNKNLFTATELYNLKTTFDSGNLASQLKSSNNWYTNFYPREKTISLVVKKQYKRGILYYINYLFFFLFHTSRCIKRLSFKPLNEISSSYNPGQRHNLKRISPPNGGYQDVIIESFKKKFKANFGKYYSDDLISFLFPQTSVLHYKMYTETDDGVIMQEYFSKYG